MNKVILMGRLTKDPELYYSQSESPVAIAKYRLAVKHSFNKNDENDTEFINVVAFAKHGEFASRYFKKGNMVVVEGRIHESKWEDAEHIRHYRYEVIATEQHFTGSQRTITPDKSELLSKDEIAITQ